MGTWVPRWDGVPYGMGCSAGMVPAWWARGPQWGCAQQDGVPCGVGVPSGDRVPCKAMGHHSPQDLCMGWAPTR